MARSAPRHKRVGASRARRLGYAALAGAADKPHGLREVYILDDDGYLWAPGRPLAGREKDALAQRPASPAKTLKTEREVWSGR